MDFGAALAYMKERKHCARRGWSGVGQYIGLCDDDRESSLALPYLYFVTTQGEYVPWSPIQADLLTNDWYIVT